MLWWITLHDCKIEYFDTYATIYAKQNYCQIIKFCYQFNCYKTTRGDNVTNYPPWDMRFLRLCSLISWIRKNKRKRNKLRVSAATFGEELLHAREPEISYGGDSIKRVHWILSFSLFLPQCPCGTVQSSCRKRGCRFIYSRLGESSNARIKVLSGGAHNDNVYLLLARLWNAIDSVN